MFGCVSKKVAKLLAISSVIDPSTPRDAVPTAVMAAEQYNMLVRTTILRPAMRSKTGLISFKLLRGAAEDPEFGGLCGNVS